MAFNGSGVFNRLYNWVNDAAASIKIRADRMDAEMDGIATGLSTCITKDGQTTITANLPMATFRHTGVGAAVNRTDYARFDQLQDGKANWVDGGGTADAITAAYSIPITTLVDGQVCYVRATAANATTTPTFSPSGLTARTIVKNGGQSLVAGDITGDGHELILRYDLANTRWELLNHDGPASTTNAGKIEIAIDSEVDTGTDATRALSPANVSAIRKIQQNSQSADYTLVLGDAQKHILHPAADTNNRTFTIPANSSVAFPIGTAITFINEVNTLTIAITTDTMKLAGAGTTGSRTLAANGIATAIKITSTSWYISGTGLT